MKFLKGIGYLLLFLSALLMLLLFACAWKPELTDQIAALLYPDGAAYTAGETDEAVDTAASGTADAGQNMTDVSGTSDTAAFDDTQQELERTASDQEQQPAYIAPDREQLSIPEEVKGKSGYQKITGDDSEISEDEAKPQLGVGQSGDGLIFDPLYYPYYQMLDEQGQHLYRQIYANAKALIKAFAPIEPIKAGKLQNVFEAVYNDHPELFWLDTAYSCRHKPDGDCVEIGLAFNRTAKNLERENAAFENAAEEILSTARGLTQDYDKERYVHDMLIQKTEYARSAEMNQSAYSALVNGKTVCAGYARAFQYLLQQLQIPCYYCTGYAGEAHAWNIICLDDEYYNVDVTWDDTESGISNYFNKTDADYADTHIREDMSVYLPPCNGEKYRSEDIDDMTAEKGRKSSEELGFFENEILHSMEEYYADCAAQIVQHGKGDFSFDNVIEGKELYEEWERAYDRDAYKEAYMTPSMRQIGAKSCHIRLSSEPLQQGRYLITHELQLQ